ncbi:unnamed protein product [Bursaphelenchus xylophilus]|uniref:3-hydroxy-3-methylglutaryl coenzyme A reductase n=1 Tax=Bursaphelenchus xylophilus TaxID=6326 RepID=A0A1I7RRA9_BURXY|nr:unnamed protein product [Bursaphelenchus xylophilus]CAG9130906.1 unnamed protein product [Bursaphelenchus xylophilus]
MDPGRSAIDNIVDGFKDTKDFQRYVVKQLAEQKDLLSRSVLQDNGRKESFGGLRFALDSQKANTKMTLLDLGVKVQDILSQHGVVAKDGHKLTKELMDLVEYWNAGNKMTTFSIDCSSEDSRDSLDEPDYVDAGTQTEEPEPQPTVSPADEDEKSSEVLKKLLNGTEKHRNLEKLVSPSKAVELRRKYVEHASNVNLDNLPHGNYNYDQVLNACCENVIGFMPIPCGAVGPLLLNGEHIYVPMATTEGALLASTNRGCSALASGVTAFVEKDSMTRAPVIQFERVEQAFKFKEWILAPQNYQMIKEAFQSTSRFARLTELSVDLQGNYVHLRFAAQTGDAMGMNMISKAVEAAMNTIDRNVHKFKYISISGNQCADKKAAAINWIKGRGKTVHAEAKLTAKTVKDVLKTSVDEMVDLAKAKLLVGSSSGITIGGWNAHAANVVAAIFLATGQDAAQVVSSSMCITMMEKTSEGDLHISCSMKCVEVGTVGGGTILEAQRNALSMLKCAGAHPTKPGANAQRLAKIICATVLAGELSLLASQCSKDLVKTHLKFNRSTASLPRIVEENQITRIPDVKPLERAYKSIAPVNCSSTF